MDTLKQNKEEIERLAGIYLVANTPYFLYSKFRNDRYVQALGKYSFEQITKTIQEIGTKGIDTIEELAFVYALYISLTYKEYEKVSKYFQTEGAITFEWFPDVRSIYISSYIPFSTAEISIGDSPQPTVGTEQQLEIDVMPYTAKKGVDNSKHTVFQTLEIHK